MEKNPAAVRVVLQRIHDVVDLIDGTAILRRPGSPLRTIDGAKITTFGGPLVPDRHAVLIQPFDVGVTAQHPDEFVGDALEMQLLGRQQREAIGQVMAELPAEDSLGPGAGTVTFLEAVLQNIFQQVVVCLHAFSLIASFP
ncbi:hypothetical protein D9M71_677750 [compost metagenome]